MYPSNWIIQLRRFPGRVLGCCPASSNCLIVKYVQGREKLKKALLNIKGPGLAGFKNKMDSYSQTLQIAKDAIIK